MHFLRFLLLLLTLVHDPRARGQAFEAGEDTADPPDLAVDLILWGIASPVGVVGVDFIFGHDDVSAIDVGVGRGNYGDHVTVNARHYFESPTRNAHYLLLGSSYSAGREPEEVESGRIKPEVGDAVWLNLALGVTRTSASGFRYGVEYGLTVITAGNLRRKSEGPRTRDGCGILGCYEPRVSPGLVMPTVSPVRIGFEF